MMANYFLRIKEANAEIVRLTSELTAAQEKAKLAEENLTALTEICEGLKQEVATATASATQANTERDAAKAEAVQVKASVAADIEKAASAKALEIVAVQGAKPLPASPKPQPASDNEDISKLKGLAKVEAALRAETLAKAAAQGA